MRYFHPYFILCLFLVLSGCGCLEVSGDTREEERQLGEFSSLTLDGSADVIIRKAAVGAKNRVLVRAAADALPIVKTNVSGSKLSIEVSRCLRGNARVEIELWVNEISKIRNDGSGFIRSENVLKTDRFDLFLDGSGQVSLKLNANRIKVRNDGSGKVEIVGKTGDLEVRHDGSGETDLSKLSASKVKVQHDGSGNVYVLAKEKMNLELDGSGNIFYSGSPKEVKTNKDGSGEIHEVK